MSMQYMYGLTKKILEKHATTLSLLCGVTLFLQVNLSFATNDHYSFGVSSPIKTYDITGNNGTVYKNVPFALKITVYKNGNPATFNSDTNIYFTALDSDGIQNQNRLLNPQNNTIQCVDENGNSTSYSGGGGGAMICTLLAGQSSFTIKNITINDPQVSLALSVGPSTNYAGQGGRTIYGINQPDQFLLTNSYNTIYINQDFYLNVQSQYGGDSNVSAKVLPVAKDTKFIITTGNANDSRISGELSGVIPAGQSITQVGPIEVNQVVNELQLTAIFQPDDNNPASRLDNDNITISVNPFPATTFALKEALPLQPVTLQNFNLTVNSINSHGAVTSVDKDIQVTLTCDGVKLSNATETMLANTSAVTFKNLNTAIPGPHFCSAHSSSLKGGPGNLNFNTINAGIKVLKGHFYKSPYSTGPVAGQPFSIQLQYTDRKGIPFTPQFPTDIRLSTSTGTLNGKLTQTIPAQTNPIIFTGLTYSNAIENLIVKATPLNNNANSGSSDPFPIQEATFQVNTPSPASKVIGQPFNLQVTAIGMNDDHPFPVGDDVIVSLANVSGKGISNIQTATIKAGQSSVTFNNLISDATTPFTLKVSADGFTSKTSSSINQLTEFTVNPGNSNGTCPGSACSLQGAIQAANSIQGGATIILNAGTYNLNGQTLQIHRNINLEGAGSSNTFINGGSTGTLDIKPNMININAGVTANISNLTIENANASSFTGKGQGGAIYSQGSLTLDSVVLNNNIGDLGGSIFSTGILTINNTTFSKNLADGVNGGGAIYSRGPLNITNSTFNNNRSSGSGSSGADITIAPNAVANISNSTFANNSASGNGGAIYNWGGTATLINNTFARNTASNGSSIFSVGRTFIKNNIFYGSNNCVSISNGTITSLGNNISNDETCGGQTSDYSNTDAKLSTLANNGGDTETISLQAGSPAIGAADSTACQASPINSLDQRGTTRPISSCDVGAYQTSP